jgi:hypothetical protein
MIFPLFIVMIGLFLMGIVAPVVTAAATTVPSKAPTTKPTPTPSKPLPGSPTAIPTVSLTRAPTRATTRSPTVIPTARMPTRSPAGSTPAPTRATSVPTRSPTVIPTAVRTRVPTRPLTSRPTFVPTTTPTRIPTIAPSMEPTFANNQGGQYKCAPYTASNTRTGGVIKVPCTIVACRGQTVEVSLLGSSIVRANACEGDTYLSILNRDGVEIAVNDNADATTLCSSVRFVASQQCAKYTIMQGCGSINDYCKGTTTVTYYY